jgi:hypothetical protein
VAGVTGTRTTVASRVEGLLADLRTATDKPIAVGFGISTGEHAAQVSRRQSLTLVFFCFLISLEKCLYGYGQAHRVWHIIRGACSPGEWQAILFFPLPLYP